VKGTWKRRNQLKRNILLKDTRKAVLIKSKQDLIYEISMKNIQNSELLIMKGLLYFGDLKSIHHKN